jgi:serine/threonine-protein kinase HipA
MAEVLYLSSNGVPMGTLEARNDVWSLTYRQEWIASPEAFPLSPHLALRAEPYDDTQEDGLVKKFFDNLLPEGEARIRLAKRLNANAVDSFDLLSRFGRETAGAVMISPSPELIPEDHSYTELSRPEFLERVRKTRREGGSLLQAARMSLAGAQDKMAARLQPTSDIMLVEGLLEPVDQAPTSHILKPQPPTARNLDHVVVNEFYCMNLARRLRLDVPDAHLLFAPGPEDDDLANDQADALEWIYCVRRFDRPAEGEGLRRRHQIDFLQLRNEWATGQAKYEKSSGAGLELVFSLAARYATAPAASVNALIRQRLMSYLIGNCDAHWKNYSLTWNAGRWDISPAYDLVSTLAYSWLDSSPAMTIGGCEDEDDIEAAHFRAFFERCIEPHGARIGALTLPLAALAEYAPRESKFLYESIAPRVGESNAEFLRARVMPLVSARALRAAEIAKSLAPTRVIGRRARGGHA